MIRITWFVFERRISLSRSVRVKSIGLWSLRFSWGTAGACQKHRQSYNLFIFDAVALGFVFIDTHLFYSCSVNIIFPSHQAKIQFSLCPNSTFQTWYLSITTVIPLGWFRISHPFIMSFTLKILCFYWFLRVGSRINYIYIRPIVILHIAIDQLKLVKDGIDLFWSIPHLVCP